MNRYFNALARMSISSLPSRKAAPTGNRGHVEPIHEEKTVHVSGSNSEGMDHSMISPVESTYSPQKPQSSHPQGVTHKANDNFVSVPPSKPPEAHTVKTASSNRSHFRAGQKPANIEPEAIEANHHDVSAEPPITRKVYKNRKIKMNDTEPGVGQADLLPGTGPDLKNKAQAPSIPRIQEEHTVIIKSQPESRHQLNEVSKKKKKGDGVHADQAKLDLNSIEAGSIENFSPESTQSRHSKKGKSVESDKSASKSSSNGEVLLEEHKVTIANSENTSGFETKQIVKHGIFKQARMVKELPEAKIAANLTQSPAEQHKKNQAKEPFQVENQELNLSIGAINVTVESAQPELSPGKPSQTQASGGENGTFSYSRLNRHYILRG